MTKEREGREAKSWSRWPRQRFAGTSSPRSNSECGRTASLTSKHGIRHTSGLSLRRRLHLALTSRGRRNCTVFRTIGEVLECVRNTGQLECNLVGSARPLQHDDPFSAEVESSPEQQADHEGCDSREDIMTCDGDASARDSNQVVREQMSPPGWGLWFACLYLDANPLGRVTSSGLLVASAVPSIAAASRPIQRNVVRTSDFKPH